MEKAETTRILSVEVTTTPLYKLPAWGWLEAIELRPCIELPNMDAALRYSLYVELIGPNGERIPVDVLCKVRDVA